MNRYQVIGTLAFAGFALSVSAGQAPVPANAKTLSNDEVRQALVGKKIHSQLKNGTPYSLAFNADGTDVYRESGQQPANEKWTLKDGVICLIPTGWPMECSNVKAANGELWFVNPDTGLVRYHFTFGQ